LSEVKTQTHALKLKEWAEKANLDPNDPNNVALFQQSPDSPLTAESNDLNFCDDDAILNNPRLRLLRLRDQGEPEFRGYRMVPIQEKLIHPDIFKVHARP